MTYLVNIGNSQGILIPQDLIHQAGLEDKELFFTVVAEGLLISPVRSVRKGWVEAFREFHDFSKDKLIVNDSIKNQFDEEEWEW